MKVSLAALALYLVLAPAAGAAVSPSLERGFALSNPLFEGPPEFRAATAANARRAGATWVRVDLTWRVVAPAGRARPEGFRPADPADPQYRWAAFDDAVRSIAAGGLEAVPTVAFAPDWAEGPRRPRFDEYTRPGSWKPDPVELGRFMQAAARRFRGDYPDPARPGAFLPRIRWFQIWNEPNLWPFLQPQFDRRRGRLRRFAAAHYRRMLGAAYRGVRRSNTRARVVMGGLAPFGSLRPSFRRGRTAPVAFMRQLLCLDRRLRRTCSERAWVDAYAHHPYSRGGATQRALNPDDATVPDIPKLNRIVRRAERLGTSMPRGRKPLWVTEMGWDTNPPDRTGVPTSVQARWLRESFYVLWRAGVERVLVLQLRDQPQTGSPTDRQAGILFRGQTPAEDRPKPAFAAFRFPFVVDARSRGRALAWGVPPCAAACAVVVEQLRGRRWVRLARRRGGPDRVFRALVPAAGERPLRARVVDSGATSPPARPRSL